MRIVGLRHAKKGSTIVEAWEIIGRYILHTFDRVLRRRPWIPIRRQFYTRSSDSGELEDASVSCSLAGSNEERWRCDEYTSSKGSSHGTANSASILKDRGFDLQD